MDVLRWTAYEGSPGATPAEVHGPVADFLVMLERVEAKGVGYVEVSHGDGDFPMLALSIAESHGVVHQLASESASMLLSGDGSVPPSAEIEVPVMDGPAVFTGAFVLAAESACEVVRSFARGAAVSYPGEWMPL